MAIDTADQFFTVLEKSKLLTPGQLAEARRVAAQANDSAAVAKILIRKGLITHWQAGLLLAGRTVFLVGRYKLIERLGRAGMGNVFLAEHVTMNRRVALKFISRQMGQDQAALDRFLAAARAIASLNHPNIVQAFSVDTECDRYYIVMEHFEGLDLQQLIERNGPLDYALAADYIRQAADGLAHAHAHNMTHCDIRPSSLLVNGQGVVKILDIGLSHLAGGEETAARADQHAPGAADYLAPEQALGNSDVDHRVDIYSLGCTLYFLLTGRPPLNGKNLPGRMLDHHTGQHRSILDKRPDAPPELVRICDRMMAKEPLGRFQSAAEVSRALQEWKPPAWQSKPVILLQEEELEEALPELDFSDDPWWNTLPATPVSRPTGANQLSKDAHLKK